MINYDLMMWTNDAGVDFKVVEIDFYDVDGSRDVSDHPILIVIDGAGDWVLDDTFKMWSEHGEHAFDWANPKTIRAIADKLEELK